MYLSIFIKIIKEKEKEKNEFKSNEEYNSYSYKLNLHY